MTREEAINELQNNKQDYTYIMTDDAIDMAIKALDQEPCDDAISRQAMHIELEKWITYGEYKYSNATKYLYDRIDRLPPVIPKPKTGHWINKYHEVFKYYCDKCGTGSDLRTPYCPNCGAKMESEEV